MQVWIVVHETAQLGQLVRIAIVDRPGKANHDPICAATRSIRCHSARTIGDIRPAWPRRQWCMSDNVPQKSTFDSISLSIMVGHMIVQHEHSSRRQGFPFKPAKEF